MSVHAVVADIRVFRRSRRNGDQANEHEFRDTFCASLKQILDDLVRAIGSPAPLSLTTGIAVSVRAQSRS